TPHRRSVLFERCLPLRSLLGGPPGRLKIVHQIRSDACERRALYSRAGLAPRPDGVDAVAEASAGGLGTVPGRRGVDVGQGAPAHLTAPPPELEDQHPTPSASLIDAHIEAAPVEVQPWLADRLERDVGEKVVGSHILAENGTRT